MRVMVGLAMLGLVVGYALPARRSLSLAHLTCASETSKHFSNILKIALHENLGSEARVAA